MLQQINQLLLILIFFLAWVYFFQGIITLICFIICTQVYQMVAVLSTVVWWFGQFPYTVRRMPHPKFGPACEFNLCHAFTASRRRPASTLTSAPGHISLNKLFLQKAIILFGPHYFMCVGVRLRLRHTVTSASRRRCPSRHKLARVITLLVELPYRHVRLPRGLRHR